MTLLEQFLLGVYLGVITGILPGVVAWGLGFVFKYFTRVTIPVVGVMVLAVALAGVQGGLLGLLDVEGVTSVTALLVVMMVAVYCHSKGDKMGAEFPRRVTLNALKNRTLSADVVERVGRFGQVRIHVVGEVIDMEGYAPLSDEIRRGIREGDWTFPADLPVSELESRMVEKLTKEFDLADVSVSIDNEGRATVIAAPPMSGLSKRVPKGKRAVSFAALVPTGLARGDEVVARVGDDKIRGTVVSARSDMGDQDMTVPAAYRPTETAPDGGEETAKTTAPSTTGGAGRITVAVGRDDSDKLLSNPPDRVTVKSRGTRREYELVSLIRSSGKVFRKVDIKNAETDGKTLRELAVRERHSVIVLAVRRGASRTVSPRGEFALRTGDTVFAVGKRASLDAFEEEMAK